jgi:quinol monooxygenase YgiN
MIEIVREFMVKNDARGQFELVFGPGGAWSKLFAKSPGFRGTTVMRDVKNLQRYLIIDVWESEDQQDQALVEHKEGYTDLEVTFDEWVESKIELGIFSLRTQASVRPRNKAGGTKGSRSRYNNP